MEMKVNRRGFIQGSLASAASARALSGSPLAPGARNIIDTNVYISRWPTRRLYGDHTPELVGLLREHGIVEAWTGSFEALLFKDTGGVNARLADECERHGQGILVPFGAINPKLPDMEEHVRRCQELYRMPGLRVHPNYHNYTLRDPDFERLLRVATERGLIVQIAAWMEDERCHIPLMRVPTVDLSPLAALMEKYPAAKVQVLNAFISPGPAHREMARAISSKQLLFDIGMLESVEGIRILERAVGMDRIAFGSYSPMFYTEAALLKLRESALTQAEIEQVCTSNARRLLARRG